MTIYPINLGFELTFLPLKEGEREFGNKFTAQKKANEFNRHLKKLNSPMKFKAKIDTFRFDSPSNKYIIEVNNQKTISSYRIDHGVHSSYYEHFKSLFKIAANIGLFPFFEKRKDNKLIQWPTGGGHIHCGIDLFSPGICYLPSLMLFERSLLMDYANNPFIRWIFSQWFDDENSNIVPLMYKSSNDSEFDFTKRVFSDTFYSKTIIPRFASDIKNHYPTYEIRFFDMPRTTEELFLQVKFLKHWFSIHRNFVKETFLKKDRNLEYIPPYTLTRKKWDQFIINKNYRHIIIKKFFDKLNLDIEEFRIFIDRNLETRIKFGKLV